MRFYVHHRNHTRGDVKTLVTIIVHPHDQSKDGSEQVVSASVFRRDLSGKSAKAGLARVSNGLGNK
jgi:hypothetical protein